MEHDQETQGAGLSAPFDPRQELLRERPPIQPSEWLAPVGEEEAVPSPSHADPARDDAFAEPDPESMSDGPEVPPSSTVAVDAVTGASPVRLPAPRRTGTGRRRLAPPAEVASGPTQLKAEQKLLVLDTWRRSGLPAGDFAPLVGVSKHTLYAWKARFEAEGPAGLMDRPRGTVTGSRLPEVVRRAIVMMKETNPDWGVERISDMLARGPGMGASPHAVARVLKEWGCEVVEEPTRRHRDTVRRFERALPNQLWQTDLFTFMLKRQNQRVYLVAFLDDHSRFVVSYALHASQSTPLVLEAFRAGIASYGTPAEVLTDNGSQYVTWRGKSAFAQECEKRGIRQIVASPRRPQTLGKTERFWGTLWRDFLSTAVFADLGDARVRLGHFIDFYNFQRPHQGIGGLTPADRFFGAAQAMLTTLKARVAANALKLAREGTPAAPFYLAGNVNGQAVSVHAAGDRLLMKAGAAAPVEVTLAAPVAPSGVPASPWTGAEDPLPAPGTSPLDDLGPAGRVPGAGS